MKKKLQDQEDNLKAGYEQIENLQLKNQFFKQNGSN
jgi:hypothetical protein